MAASQPSCSSMQCGTPALRRSPACGSTQPFMIPHRRGRPAGSDARGPKAHGYPHSLRASRRRTRAGAKCGAELVRGGRAHDRDRLGHRGVAARGPARRADPMGALRDPEARFPPQALLCTDPTCEPASIVGWFVRRWTVEVTFQEARAHLGVETQRQWSDTAIARTTLCLLAMFSIVTLLAAQLPARQWRRIAAAAWYPKPRPTSPMPWPPYAVRSGVSGLWHITAPTRPNKTQLPVARALGLCPLPRRMMGQSRA